MKAHLEVEINSRLRQEEDISMLADDLVKRWVRGELSNSEIHTTSQFLIQNGFINTFFDQIEYLLIKKRHVPWKDVVHALSMSSSFLDVEFLTEIFDGLDQSGHLEALAFLPFETPPLTSLKDYKEVARKKLRISWSSQKQEREELVKELIRSRKPGIAQSTFDQLKSQFPESEQIRSLEKLLIDFNDDYSEAGKKTPSRSTLDKVLKRILLEEKEIVQSARENVVDSMIKGAKANPEISYDIAIALYMMGAYDDALIVLESTPSSLKTLSLKIELLLANSKGLEVLSCAQELSEEYGNNPEVIQSSLFYSAKGLWILERRSQAISIMKELVNISPDYRTSRSLLIEWKGA